MKKKIYPLLVLLQLLFIHLDSDAQIQTEGRYVYTSPNPKVNKDDKPSDLLRINYREIYSWLLPAGYRNGGIKGKALNGKITLYVFSYDPEASNGKGVPLYACESTVNDTINFTEQSFPITAESYRDYSDFFTSNAIVLSTLHGTKSYTSTDLRSLAALVPRRIIGGDIFSTVSYWRDIYNTIPVIVEVTITDARLTALKLPMGIKFKIADLKIDKEPIADIKSRISVGAHRGNWQAVGSPENTKTAISDMLRAKYDMIELDLWSTADQKVIVFHDMGLNKRTTDQGSVTARHWDAIKHLQIKNRFDEVITTPNTKIELLDSILVFIKQKDPLQRIWLNLDRSVNDMEMFKRTYEIVRNHGLLHRAIFKGRFDPNEPNNSLNAPTVAGIRNVFQQIYPTLSPAEINAKMKAMYFTPILFDNNKGGNTTNDIAYANRVKAYIDDMADAGIADGFELNYKSYPPGHPEFANDNLDNVFLLKKWMMFGNKTFVDYVHSLNLPVGIFASVPEVCAIPDFNPNGTRNTLILKSGFIKENTSGSSPTYAPIMKDQGDFDFRGDWDFYIPAGADYIITDRPDALREYLKAIKRSRN